MQPLPQTVGDREVWNLSITNPRVTMPATLTIESAGNSFVGSIATSEETVDVVNGCRNGDHWTWEARITKPMKLKLTFSAVVADDNLEGKVKFLLGSANLLGKRADSE